MQDSSASHMRSRKTHRVGPRLCWDCPALRCLPLPPTSVVTPATHRVLQTPLRPRTATCNVCCVGTGTCVSRTVNVTDREGHSTQKASIKIHGRFQQPSLTTSSHPGEHVLSLLSPRQHVCGKRNSTSSRLRLLRQRRAAGASENLPTRCLADTRG